MLEGIDKLGLLEDVFVSHVRPPIKRYPSHGSMVEQTRCTDT